MLKGIACLAAGGACANALAQRAALLLLAVLTAREQRPVDLLQLLSQMETENLRMPRRACAALSPGGGSLLSAWLEERLHVLRDHRATVAEAEQGVNPRSFTYVDGVQLGMANCVADNYGARTGLGHRAVGRGALWCDRRRPSVYGGLGCCCSLR